MAQKGWVYSPGSGGVKIPDHKKNQIKQRIEKFAAENYAGKYTRLEIRFRGKFCYIDAYTEPFVAEGWPPDGWPETREEMIERLRNTPTHLCRLLYYDDDKWGFAFYAYSSEKYELSMFPNGSFTGTPEEAFAASAMYLE
ncbi:MAG: hypothetical protein H6667_11630 [Ardenticatenaceae bacterium]|nr:hypothetical protein [Ardenticatenaceae bacterium]